MVTYARLRICVLVCYFHAYLLDATDGKKSIFGDTPSISGRGNIRIRRETEGSGQPSEAEGSGQPLVGSVQVTWGDWSEYGDCNVTCGNGTRQRTRLCMDPDITCVGEDSETVACNNATCGTWNDWSEYGACSVTCGNGTRQRTRTCMDPDNTWDTCAGNDSQMETCNKNTDECKTVGCPGLALTDDPVTSNNRAAVGGGVSVVVIIIIIVVILIIVIWYKRRKTSNQSSSSGIETPTETNKNTTNQSELTPNEAHTKNAACEITIEMEEIQSDKKQVSSVGKENDKICKMKKKTTKPESNMALMARFTLLNNGDTE